MVPTEEQVLGDLTNPAGEAELRHDRNRAPGAHLDRSPADHFLERLVEDVEGGCGEPPQPVEAFLGAAARAAAWQRRRGDRFRAGYMPAARRASSGNFTGKCSPA